MMSMNCVAEYEEENALRKRMRDARQKHREKCKYAHDDRIFAHPWCKSVRQAGQHGAHVSNWGLFCDERNLVALPSHTFDLFCIS